MAGAGYKLFNTGDVLTAAQVNTYLMEQTVMVFANAAARTTALSGVVSEGMISYLKDTNAVEVYDGSNWVSSDDPNAIQNSIINAKGDLIVGSANDTPSILSVSSDGSTLVADSSTSTGLRYTAGNPVGNPVINGAFDVWQRGTSVAGANSISNYSADRWVSFRTNYTFSRQSVGDTTNLPTIQYCMRAQRNSGVTATDDFALSSSFETSNSIRFAGQTVTLSFWARKGANYSATSSAFKSFITTGTGTDQNGLGGLTGGIDYVQTNTLTTTWQRFTQTQALNSTVTQVCIQFVGTPTGTAGAADYIEITGIQLDLGSVALPFRRSGNTLAGEFLACCRYFQRLVNGAETTNETITMTQAFSTTQAYGTKQFLVPMRTAPTISYSNNTHFIVKSATGTDTATTAMSSGTISSRTTNITISVASGLVAGNAAWLLANNASATMDASSEL